MHSFAGCTSRAEMEESEPTFSELVAPGLTTQTPL